MTDMNAPALLSWMHDATRVRIARFMAAISVVLGVAGNLALAVMGQWAVMISQFVVNLGVTAIGLGVVTAVVLGKQPRNGAVWVLAWSATISSVAAFTTALTAVLTRNSIPDIYTEAAHNFSPSDLPLSTAVAFWVSSWAWLPGFFFLLTLGLLLFPDGRLLSARWKWLGWLNVVTIAAASFGLAWLFWPTKTVNLDAPSEDQPQLALLLSDAGYLVLFVLWLLSLGHLVLRFRRSSSEVRSQIRLIAGGGAAFLAGGIGGTIAGGFYEAGEPLGLLAGQIVFVATFAAAILKFRLYDIDVVLSKSVTYLGLVVVITALYAAVVVGPLLVIGRSDVGDPGLVLPILATALVAVLFEPIRSRLQRTANRLVFGVRASPHEVLSRVTASLPEEGSGTDDLARLLAGGTGADQAIVWLRNDDHLQSHGIWSKAATEAPPPTITLDLTSDEFNEFAPVRHEEVPLGAISITKPRNDPVTPADRELLADVAAGAGLLLRNIRLNQQLVERANEVRESRRRLIAAQDAERRRLERDLHDGAQQQVVALKVKLGIAKTIAEREGADEIASRIVGLAEETQHAVDGLRAVAHGIYPPLLESEGLATALSAMMRSSPMALAVETSGLGRYAPPTEQTIYFCVLETLERAHMAGVKQAQVAVAERNGDLVIEFDLEGTSPQLDLTAVTDRLDAADGTIQLTPTGDATEIVVALPARRLEPAWLT